MDEECALHADTVRDPAHRHVRTKASSGDANHKALEDLNALAGALHHLGVHPHGVARAELGQLVFLLLLFDLVDDVHDNLNAGEPPRPCRTVLACARRHRSMAAWLPDSKTSGTLRPRHSAGLVNCGYPPPAPCANASCASDASSPRTPATRRATASISTMAGSSPPLSTKLPIDTSRSASSCLTRSSTPS